MRKILLLAIIICLFLPIAYSSDVWDRPLLNNTIIYYNNTIYVTNNITNNITNDITNNITIIYNITNNITNDYHTTIINNITNNITIIYNMTYNDTAIWEYAYFLNQSITDVLNALLIVNQSIKQPVGDYLTNDSTTFFLNESKLNMTIRNISKIYPYAINISCYAVAGSCSNVSLTNASFTLKQIIVTPATSSNAYAFQMTDMSNNIIDRNRMIHVGQWNILKDNPMNAQLSVNIYNASIDELFNIQVLCLINGVE